MKGIGYLPSEIDHCLFIKEEENNQEPFVIINVDDGGIFCTEADIKETI